jgi:hypothetical protein
VIILKEKEEQKKKTKKPSATTQWIDLGMLLITNCQA